ncbi:sensor histidine kinase [Paludibacterium paludis]|uniref:histidine kinase n=1 Tax=Paludibacterium paludis TaxID=1225769 RepID=A0A918U849_9NEIS|nr:sensor histidine kinase KdpD [Paludibacterium paludis]GGY07702.1 two-component sensor histidine kinase [Paludibacterium paludis]
MIDPRPDPDDLLDELRREEAAARRGRLKIFFGACAGVGKTYAMLAAAKARQKEGIQVLVGVVETHGRSETAAMLEGLDVLPSRELAYKGRQLAEFDLDSALACHPQLILVDEFAHSNAPGSRHPKRWQDVEELLAAGIDVYTTLNVQHLESLNDIVGRITGIVVRETLPDQVFDTADDVSLVDLPPDELIGRLNAGKVYLPRQAERAIRHFFRKGNLLALRELALRRTADRVDAQMRAYRANQSIQPVWQARERLLVCVGNRPGGERLVRAAKRLAANLDADWLVVHVETPGASLGENDRQRLLKVLRLAQDLGAETSVLAGSDLAGALLAYARSRNVSKLVVARHRKSALMSRLRPSLVDHLSRMAEDVDVYVVAHDMDEGEDPVSPVGKVRSLLFDDVSDLRRKQGVAAAVIASGLTTALSALLIRHFELANVIMVYLLVVVMVASRYGRVSGVLASFLSVAMFDFFFVPPRMSFSVSDTQYLLTFLVMLAVSLIISQQTARQRFEARAATFRERRTRVLYDLGRELAGALTGAQIVDTAERHVGGLFNVRPVFFVPDGEDRLKKTDPDSGGDPGVAQWVYDNQQPAGRGTNTLPSTTALYVPLKAPMRVRGVLAILLPEGSRGLLPDELRLLETCAAQIALALERVHYVEVAQDAIVAMESERLRNSVLATVSHDLRTPLTTLVGLASLLEGDELAPDRRKRIAASINDEAQRMNRLVTNLLDMARLQSGVKPNKEWQYLDDVIGSAVRSMGPRIAAHPLKLDLPADLPLLDFDEVLLERVLVNLLDNACKYASPGTDIRLSVRREGDEVKVSVSDNGPGWPTHLGNSMFDKFTRGAMETSVPGVGLGLAICRGIVEAHGGTIKAENTAPQGATVTFSLPVGQPPVVPE